MKGYIPTLDGWRAVAILGVLLCHGSFAFLNRGGVVHDPRWLDLCFRGSYGVDIFFGISGFLITSRLLEERRRSGRIDVGRFYARRAFRILPASLTFLGVLALLSRAFPIAVEPGEWWTCLLFSRNYLPSHGGGGWFTDHFWSLSAEEHFYMLWPATLCSLLATSAASRARVWAFGLALGTAAWAEFEHHARLLDRVLPSVFMEQRTDVRLDGLLWGCFMAMTLADPARREALTRWLGKPWVRVTLALAFVATVMNWLPGTGRAIAAMVPLLLAATALHPGSAAGRLLEWSPLRRLGRLSYSVYLWQQLFLLPAKELAESPLGALQHWPLNVVSIFACATLSYVLIERPMVRLGHRLAGVTPVLAVDAVPPPHFRAGGVADDAAEGVAPLASGRDIA